MDTTYTIKHVNIDLPSFEDHINLHCFGDVHYDTAECDKDRFRYFLKNAEKDDPERTYYLGMGDYHDFASASEQKHLKNGKIHETTMSFFDDIVEQKNREFASVIKQMRGRMIGMIEGNHSWTFPNGTTSTMDLASRMEAEYLGWLSHITLSFNFANRGTRINVHIVACHGKAGGKTHGVTINQVADLKSVFPIADIYVMGHDHQRGAWSTSCLYPTHGGGSKTLLKEKRQWLCRSGSFKRAYVDGKSTYEAGRLLRPADLGAIKLQIGFRRDWRTDKLVTEIQSHT
jgi:hypothetical protein